jgi:two-component system sensor histidine kinase TctE
MRAQLLRLLLVPLAVLVAINTYSAYYSAVKAANAAYDRSLLASARTIADKVHVDSGQTTVDIPYVALGMFEAYIEGRIYYKVTGLNGEFVSGYDDLPPLRGDVERSEAYPALVRFYDDTYRTIPLRVAALQQPLYDGKTYGAALIQVAESIHSRQALTQQILLGTLYRQLVLVICAVVVVALALRLAFRPLNRLTVDLERRLPTDLSMLSEQLAHQEIRPLIQAINHYIGRVRSLIDSQKRFVGEASHQLRTSLTLLQTQAGVGMRQTDLGGALEVINALHASANHIIRLANQLLSRARAQHGSVTQAHEPVNLAKIVRDVCLENSHAALKKYIDLAFENSQPVMVAGDPLLLHELVTNLLENALRYTPHQGRVTVRVFSRGRVAILEVEDTGPGIPPAEREKVFEPFYKLAFNEPVGAGLGLSIARDIANAHAASIELLPTRENRGLLVTVSFKDIEFQDAPKVNSI